MKKKREEKERLKPGMIFKREPSKLSLYGAEYSREGELLMNVYTLGQLLIYIDERPDKKFRGNFECEVYCIENGSRLFLGKEALLNNHVRIECCQRKKKKKT